MSLIHGTYRDGRIDLDRDVNWPDGSRVAVVPPVQIGLTEAEWPETPEGRAALAARFDAIEPMEMTPQDHSEINEARLVTREATLREVRRRMGLEP